MTIPACQAGKYTVAEIGLHTSIMDTLGKRLRAARLAKGLTQDEMADELELTKSTVSAWENDRIAPSIDKLPRLREVLSTSLDALVCGDRPLGAWELRVGEQAAAYPPKRQIYEDDPEEQRLLRFFRAMTDAKRRALLLFIRPDS